MRRFATWRDVPVADRGASLALGNFDGVHLGHQAVIDAARAGAAPLGVAVFNPHPRRFFQPAGAPFRLTSNELRARLLAGLGVKRLYEIPFDRDLSMRDDRGFVRDVLVEGLGVTHVAVGFDYRFGRDRVGDADSLGRLGAEFGFGVSIVEPVDEGGAKCSSSAIRAALERGEVERAAALLTRPWIVDGVVERGDQRGRTLGFPTANVPLGALLRPRFGVYAVRVLIEGEDVWRPGVANIGERPTFDGADARVEAHVFDYAGDLYGRHVQVGVFAFLRDERRFESLAELTAQIARDADAARGALSA